MKELGRVAILALLTSGLSGCGGTNLSPEATVQQLQQSYESAGAPIKQEVSQASAALQAGNYTEAVVLMNRVVQSQPVSLEQKQAVANLIRQTQLAVRQNPKLNNAELYRATSELILRVHGEN